MTDKPTPPAPDDDLPGMPAPPPLDGPSEPTTLDTRRSPRAWIWIAAAVVALLAGLAVLSLAGGDDTPGPADDNHFSDHGVSFDYPSDWQDFGPATFQVNSGDVQWSESFGIQAGSDAAIVTEYALKKDVSSVSAIALQAELDRLFTRTVFRAGGEMNQPISATEINGIEGYRVGFTSTVGGTDLTTDMVLVFRGTQQWNIQCQYTDGDQHDVLPGCHQIWDTFTIEG